MNKSPLPTILLSVLALSAVASVVLCWLFINTSREMRGLNDQATRIKGRSIAIDALVNDLREYSKHNPQIDPILDPVLESAGIKRSTTSTNKPAAN